LMLPVRGNRLNQPCYSSANNQPHNWNLFLEQCSEPDWDVRFTSEKINKLTLSRKRATKKLSIPRHNRSCNDWSSALATPFTADNTSFFLSICIHQFYLSNVVELPRVIDFAKSEPAMRVRKRNDTNPYQTQEHSCRKRQWIPSLLYKFRILSNANLKPRNYLEHWVGFDLRLLKQRLNVDFTYYNATDDQILSLPIAVSQDLASKWSMDL
jgi:hypothetical protein